MPKRYLGEGGRKAWNILNVVGYGGGAPLNDVKLVQYLLNVTTRQMVRDGRMEKATSLTQDGMFGPNTSAAIWAVQKEFSDGTIDGRISQMRSPTFTYGSQIWTLYKLEANYTADLFQLGKDVRINAAMYNEAMDWLPFDDALAASVRTEMFAGNG